MLHIYIYIYIYIYDISRLRVKPTVIKWILVNESMVLASINTALRLGMLGFCFRTSFTSRISKTLESLYF